MVIKTVFVFCFWSYLILVKVFSLFSRNHIVANASRLPL